jgi:peptide chain release factor-like protein
VGRSAWANLSDSELLAQCEVDTYRASGPGGQKRNKTSSAVRIRHPPSGLIVIAEESRSQHENRARALRRLRRAFYLQIREPPHNQAGASLEVSSVRDASGRIRLRPKDPRFWPTVGVVLDALEAMEGRVADTAVLLGITTGNLVDFLEIDSKVWQQANQFRTRFGHKSLKS